MRRHVPGRRATIAWLTALTLVALGLRLSLIPTRVVAENDGPYYIALAAELLRGHWSGALNPYWSQFYPVAIGIVGIFTGVPELAARLVSALCGAALIPAIWWLTHETAEPRVAWLAALLAVFQPWLLVFSVLPLTEMLFTLLIVLALALAVYAARRGGLQRFGLAGCVTALAILTRPEGVLLVLVLLGAGVVRLLRYRSWQPAREAIVAFGALIVIMAPQTTATYEATGKVNFLWKSSVNVIVGEAYDDSGQTEQTVYSLDHEGRRTLEARAGQMSLGQYWLRYPGQALRRMLANILMTVRDRLFVVLLPVPPAVNRLAVVALALLALLGLAAGLLGRRRAGWFALLGYLAAYSVGLWSVLVHHRLLVPLVPFFLIPAATGCSVVIQVVQGAARRFIRPPYRQAAGRAALIGASGLLLWAAFSSYLWAYSRSDPFAAEPVAQKEAGLWLRANAPQSARLMSHNPQTPLYFYEGWPFERALALPWAEPDEVLAFAQGQGVRYIALEEWVVGAAHFPAESWLDTSRSHAGLQLLRVFGTPPNRVVLYEITN